MALSLRFEQLSIGHCALQTATCSWRAERKLKNPECVGRRAKYHSGMKVGYGLRLTGYWVKVWVRGEDKGLGGESGCAPSGSPESDRQRMLGVESTG